MASSPLRNKLEGRLTTDDLFELCYLTQGICNDFRKEELFALTDDADDRVATNALWAFTYFDLHNNQWLYAKHDRLIDRALSTSHPTKLRLLLTLLLRQPFTKEKLRTDFLDFCLSDITSASHPCAVRVLCTKLAYEQCRFHPELLTELRTVLDLLSSGPIPPGLASARRQLLKKLKCNMG